MKAYIKKQVNGKCDLCQKITEKTFKRDEWNALCWECLNRMINLEMERDERDENQNQSHGFDPHQEAKSREEFDFYIENGWAR